MTEASAGPRWDWSQISDEAVLEMLRQGEMRLADLLAVSVAADQRATTLSGIFAAAAAGLTAAASTLAVGSNSDLAAIVSIAVMAVFLLGASMTCAYAARPIDFGVRGYEPAKLMSSATDLGWMRRYLVQQLEVLIAHDLRAVARTARLTTIGSSIAASSVIAAIVAFLVLHLWH